MPAGPVTEEVNKGTSGDGHRGNGRPTGKVHGHEPYIRIMAVRNPLVKRALLMLGKDRYDAAMVVDLLRKADKEGDAEAAYALGTWHLFGKHVPLDAKLAAQYLKRATDRNFPDAAYDLAVSYEKGVGVEKDPGRAFSLYMKAALLGDSQAMYEVGRCFYWGIGTEKDRDAARVWFDAYERGQFRADRTVERRRVRRAPIKVS